MVEVSHCCPLFYSIGNGGPCAWHNMFAPPQKKSASFIAWGKIMIGYFLMNPTAALKQLSAFATFFGMLAVSVINSLRLFAQLGGDILWARKRLTQFHFLQGTSTVRMVVLSDDAPNSTYECYISIWQEKSYLIDSAISWANHMKI